MTESLQTFEGCADHNQQVYRLTSLSHLITSCQDYADPNLGELYLFSTNSDTLPLPQKMLKLILLALLVCLSFQTEEFADMLAEDLAGGTFKTHRCTKRCIKFFIIGLRLDSTTAGSFCGIICASPESAEDFVDSLIP